MKDPYFDPEFLKILLKEADEMGRHHREIVASTKCPTKEYWAQYYRTFMTTPLPGKVPYDPVREAHDHVCPNCRDIIDDILHELFLEARKSYQTKKSM